jgi:hypothetical protein
MVVVTCLGADSERLYFPIGRNAIERYRHIILRYAKVVSDPHAGHVKKRSGNSIGTTCREKDHVTTGQSAINVEKAEEHQPSHAKKKKKNNNKNMQYTQRQTRGTPDITHSLERCLRHHLKQVIIMEERQRESRVTWTSYIAKVRY